MKPDYQVLATLLLVIGFLFGAFFGWRAARVLDWKLGAADKKAHDQAKREIRSTK